MKTRSRVRPLKSLVGDWQVQWWVNERWSCRGHFTTFDKAYQYASIIVPPHGIPYQAPKKSQIRYQKKVQKKMDQTVLLHKHLYSKEGHPYKYHGFFIRELKRFDASSTIVLVLKCECGDTKQVEVSGKLNGNRTFIVDHKASRLM